MSPSSKKQKLDPISTAIAALDKLDMSYTEPTHEDRMRFFEKCMEGLRPGPFLVGNEEEERAYREEIAQTATGDDADEDEEKSKGIEKDDDEEDRPGLVRLPDGEVMTAAHYYGTEWKQMIVSIVPQLTFISVHSDIFQLDLHSVEPMTPPETMKIKPHDYQCKGAAQINFLCSGPFQGCLIGDPMGLGKTLQAIMSMRAIKDLSGIILVVCPATLCQQWVENINEAFEKVRRI